jgi:hypothetical protein
VRTASLSGTFNIFIRLGGGHSGWAWLADRSVLNLKPEVRLALAHPHSLAGCQWHETKTQRLCTVVNTEKPAPPGPPGLTPSRNRPGPGAGADSGSQGRPDRDLAGHRGSGLRPPPARDLVSRPVKTRLNGPLRSARGPAWGGRL